MKKLLALFLAINLSACSIPYSIGQEALDGPTEYDEATYYYWPSQGDSKVLYEVVTLEEEGFTGEYPQISNLQAGHPLRVISDDYREDIDKALQEQQVYAAELAAEGEDLFAPYDHSIGWLGGRYHPELWSLAFQIYSYTGGAHPNHWTDTYNYHPKSNTILKLEDLFSGEKVWDVLDTSVMAGVISEKQKRWDQWDTQEPYDPTQDFFMEEITFDAKMLNRWVVAKKEGLTGLMFFFAPYEIGPYAEGGYEVFVPIAVLKEWVKEEFKDVF